ncbi:unnamed protein product [Auanema sp. JU1783]|nr:unnamed protein product [Auanema sp. JU1783]
MPPSSAEDVPKEDGDLKPTVNGLKEPSKPSSKISFVQVFDDDEEEEVLVEKNKFDKFINYLFCRGDLADETLKARPVPLVGLFRYCTKFDILLLAIGILGAIVSGFAQPLLSLFSGDVFDIMLNVPHDDPTFRSKGFLYVYLYIGLGLFILVVNFIQFCCFQHVCCRLVAQIRHNYMKSILRQNAGWFDKNHCGVLTTQLNDNIERIREGIGDKLGMLIRGFAMFTAALIVAFMYDWRIALFMSPVAVLSCGCMSLMSRKMAEATSKELADVGSAGAIAEEAIMGIRTVQAFNGQEEMIGRYRDALSKGKKHAMTKSFWSGFLGGVFYVILFLFMGSGLLLGGYLYRIGTIDNPGNVITAVLSMMIGAYFLGLISPHLMVLLNARVAAAIIYQTIDRKPRIDVYSKSGTKPNELTGDIEFIDVHFRYPTRRDVKVLDGINLRIEKGQTVALVGHSGCGKSTTIGLLTRLYEAESGQTLIDGIDVRDLNIEWLRNKIGIVQQEPNLFNDTISENLRIGYPHLTEKEMVRICKMANAHDFIMKLPKGYNTVIGDGGVQLSGGQKQRIAIARTLARNPKILLLDEATSALDAQSESIVQEALDKAAAGRTTIIIAHRLSTIRNADKIVVFEKGNILEQGSHSELIEADGRYAQLVKAQQFNKEEEKSKDEEISLDDEEPMLKTPQTGRLSRQVSESSNFGPEEFVRATEDNDSFVRSSYRMSSTGAAGVDGEVFAEKVRVQMETDEKVEAGLFTIYRYGHGNYIKMIIAFSFAIIRGLEMPILSIVFGWVYSAFEWADVDNWRLQHELVLCLIAFTVIGLATCTFHALSSMLFGSISENMTLKFRLLSFGNILHQDAAYFDNPQHAPGRLITRLASDAPNTKAVIDGRMMYVVFNVTAWSICLVISLLSCWAVGLLAVVLSLCLGVIMIILARTIHMRNVKLMRKNPAGKFSIEIIENVRTIQLITRENYFFGKYQTASKSQKRDEMFKGYFEAINYSITQSFIFFALGCAYALGIHIVSMDLYPTDSVYRAILATMLSCLGIMNCTSFFPEFVKAKTASGMLFNTITRKSATGDHKTGEKLKLRGNILFQDVHFVYPQRPHQAVMRGLTFTARKGQTVALVGPSGSGKSTVISMIERFYDTIAGAVRVDGNDIKKLSLHHLRTQVALVGQEPRLFAGTIRDNIKFGMEDVSEDQIRLALETANASNFVNSMPQGLDTEVGEKGTQLSGGQKQRIAIARAIVRDPAVLLLDEATSALDSESERAVQQALDKAREGRTCITIAHRLSSIQNADLIIYVENGRVRESGTHSQLLSKRGKYYELIQKQDLSS